MDTQAKIPKKLAIINDLTGYGRCSHAVAIPVVSVMGVQACPVPTSVFSNHMAFPIWHKTDYTPQLQEYLACWEELDLRFDGVLCGFLGNTSQVSILSAFMESQKKKGSPLIVLDPVMGDHGKLYSSVPASYTEDLKKLLAYADILTPNLTEACLLTGTPFPDCLPGEAALLEMAEKLHGMGPSKVVITGLSANGLFHNFVSESTGRPFHALYTTKAGGPSRPGTGDLFASIVAADALNGVSFSESIQKAADFVRICTEGSAAANLPIREGVCFENYLGKLLT